MNPDNKRQPGDPVVDRINEGNISDCPPSGARTRHSGVRPLSSLASSNDVTHEILQDITSTLRNRQGKVIDEIPALIKKYCDCEVISISPHGNRHLIESDPDNPDNQGAEVTTSIMTSYECGRYYLKITFVSEDEYAAFLLTKNKILRTILVIAEAIQTEEEKLDQARENIIKILHYIKNKLSGIIPNIHWFLNSSSRFFLNEQEVEALEDCITSALDVDKLCIRIQRLLAKTEHGALELSKSKVQIRELLKKLLGKNVSNPNIEYIDRISLDDIVVSLDEILFEGVMDELKINAEKILKSSNIEDPTIIISAFQDEDQITIEVSDNGPGLKGDPEKIFDMHVRGESNINSPGWGGGLAFCKTIIEAHGGTISAGNEIGSTGAAAGAVFTITIPINQEINQED